MKKNYSKFLALLLSIFMCLQITPIVHARESKSLLYNNLYGDAIPTDVYSAAESHANDLIDLAVTSILTDTKKMNCK